jgi:PAS domain S-box-containing protein
MPYQWPLAAQYALALGAVAGSLLARWVLDDVLGQSTPFFLTLAVLIPLALLVRPGPFLAAAAAAWAGPVFLFLPRQMSFMPAGDTEAIMAAYFLAVLALATAAVAWLSARRQREDEERYRAIAEQSPDAIFVNVDGRLVYANAAAVRLLGARSGRDVLGRKATDVIAEEDHSQLQARVADVRERGIAQPAVEYRCRRLDGRIIPIEATARPFEWRGARAVLVSARDLTARKAAEDEVRFRAEQFEVLLDKAPVGVYLIDSEFRIRQVNPVARRLFEAIAGGTVGRDVDEVLRIIWPQRIADEIVGIVRRALTTGESYQMPNFEGVRADLGITEYYDWRVDRITLPDGRHGVVCYYSDITWRKQVENALRESEARLHVAQAAAQLGLHDFDVAAGVVEWDARTRELWGVPDDLPITYELWRDSLHPDDREQAEAAVQAALDPAGDGRYLAQYRVRSRRDGITRWIEATGQASFADGRAVRLIGTTRDITEQKQAEAVLRDDDRRKDDFIATLAHELRNPLAAIRMGVRVLGRADIPPPQRERMHAIIDRQSAQLVRMIDDLLDVSRITRGKIDLRRERISMGRVLEHAAEGVRELCQAKGVRLTLEMPDPPLVIDADAFRLVQVLTNLMNNACKFTERGGAITVAARRDGQDAVVRVRDTGIGIPREQLGRIFDMFTQVEGMHGADGGLGIGLSLARSLIALHGGSIEAHSAGPGHGSEFVVRVPALADVQQVPAAAFASEAEAAAAAGPARGEERPAQRRVLAVDDNPDALEAMATMLRNAGHAVEVAAAGEEAWEKACSWRPDAVLLDIGLPGIDGYEVARRIRSERWGHDVLLVALTGWGRDVDRARAQQAGFDAHVTKPAEADELERLILADRGGSRGSSGFGTVSR